MAYAKELVAGSLSPGQAGSIGGAYLAVTAAGSVQGDAAALTASMNVVASADGTKGVILQGQPGDSVIVFNNSASTLKVWPPVGDTIAVPGTGIGTVNSAFSHLTYKTVKYYNLDGTQWLPQVTA